MAGQPHRHKQDAEKLRQRRSRIVQILNVPERVRLRSSLAAALPAELFEHPAGVLSASSRCADDRSSCHDNIVFPQLSSSTCAPVLAPSPAHPHNVGVGGCYGTVWS